MVLTFLGEGSYDATVRLWDCKSQSTKPIQIFEEAKDSVSSVHVSGHEIAAGSVDGRVRLYDLRMGMMYVDVVGRECPYFINLAYLRPDVKSGRGANLCYRS